MNALGDVAAHRAGSTRPLWLTVLQGVLRFGLGGLILATGLGKALDVAGFNGVLQTYRLGLGSGLLWAIGLAVTIFELVLGLWILGGRKLARAMKFAVALNLGYFVLMTSSLWRGLDLQNCGCYGVYLAQPLRWYSPVEDLVLVVLSLVLLNIVTERLRVQASIVIHAPCRDVAEAYRDFRDWPRIFPATIRGARLLRGESGRQLVEVDHRVDGRVINVLEAGAEDAIGLEEFKRRYDGRFENRFEPVAGGTRYTVSAEIRAKGAWKLLLGPCARSLVRQRIARGVLLPLKKHMETAPG